MFKYLFIILIVSNFALFANETEQSHLNDIIFNDKCDQTYDKCVQECQASKQSNDLLCLETCEENYDECIHNALNK
jgi:hypothetical protein